MYECLHKFLFQFADYDMPDDDSQLHPVVALYHKLGE